ncbi:chemotaxis protein CheA [Magnetococcus sp. PR-3]|uniref:chemotaxis protein CheA n=1 Tax=Magnetococcus sp. PR-3 TaxID=3120355 RepID=UPI002FCE3D27
MSDFIESLWQEFSAETEEHLEQIETYLLESNSRDLAHDEIAALFRAFHSLKGLSRAMSLHAMETVAHNAENLLGLVRNGTLPNLTEINPQLLQSVDELRALRESGLETRSDGQAPQSFVNTLEKLYTSLNEPATAIKAPEPSTVAPIEEPQPQTPTQTPEQDLALDDNDEMISLYAENLSEQLPLLPALLEEDAQARNQARQYAEELAHGASVVGFEGLSDELSQLACLRDDSPLSQYIDLLHEIGAQTELITEMTGFETGQQAFLQAVASPLFEELAKQGNGLADYLHALDVNNPNLEQVRALTPALTLLHRLCELVGAPRMGDIFLRIAELLRKVDESQTSMATALLEELSILADGVTLLDPEYPDLDPDIADELLKQIKETCDDGETVQAVSLSAEPTPLFDKHRINDELVAVLTESQIQEIEQHLRDGWQIYIVHAFLERDAHIAQTFVTWLREVLSVTNRTLFQDEETGLEFLLMTPHGPEQLSGMLAEVDADGKCLHDLKHITPEHAAQISFTQAPKPAQEAAPKSSSGNTVETTLRVRASTVNTLIDQASELLTAVSGLNERLHDDAVQSSCKLEQTSTPLLTQMRDQIHRIHRDLRLLHQNTLELRMAPLQFLYGRLTRTVHDLATTQEKQIKFDSSGGDVRLDKSIVDSLSDPLLHMVRNSCDHGLEEPHEREQQGKSALGFLSIHAEQQGGEAVLTIQDDGRGLDVERIKAKAIDKGLVTPETATNMTDAEAMRLILQPGFSTREAISETSGRGVGMDVVLTTITQLGGALHIDSTFGKGTTFTLRMPLSTAMQRVVILRQADQFWAFPEDYMRKACVVPRQQKATVHGVPGVMLDGQDFIPLVPLGTIVGAEISPPQPQEQAPSVTLSLIILGHGQQRIAIEVDEFVRRQELMFKEVHPALAAIPSVGGAGVMGDGKVVIILDALAVLGLALEYAKASEAVS